MKNKVWLNEVSFMRPFLLVFLVSYHAFAPYVGTWDLPAGIYDVEAYRWIALLSRAFRLEGFVFISGYIFTFQIIERGKFPTFRSLLSSKVQRLLVPSMFFSMLYFVCFKDFVGVGSFCKDIVGGVGHLWYLPCLFICFLVQYLLLQKNANPVYLLLGMTATAAISFVPLPMHLNKPLYYMMFFYGGGLFWRYSYKINQLVTRKKIIIAWIVFVCCFIGINLMIDRMVTIRDGLTSQPYRAAIYSLNTLLKVLMGWVGIVAFYFSAVKYCAKHIISDTIIKIGACGYGVYVTHQFVLIYLYRYTSLPSLTGSYILPWVGFTITLLVSTILTLLIRQTRIGRKYL